jgi:hypothetical protein
MKTYSVVRLVLTTALLLFAAAFMSVASARPLLVAPKRLEVPPLVQPQYPGQFQASYGTPAIDGDTLIVSARRIINEQYDTREDAHLFLRDAAGNWNYSGVLVEDFGGNIAIDGDVATLQSYGVLRIFERGAGGWALSGTLSVDAGNWDVMNYVFRIDDGSIYVERNDSWYPPRACQPPYQQWRKVNGAWSIVGTIGPERCRDDTVDVDGGRALLVERPIDTTQTQEPARVYAANGTSWSPVASLAPPPNLNYFGYGASISGTSAYIDGWLFRNTGGNTWATAGRLVEPESELGVGTGNPKLRGDTLVGYGAEEDYELRSLDWEVFHEFRTLRAYRKRADGYFDYYAKMSGDFDIWGWSVSDDGRRIAANGTDNVQGYDPVNRLYVFEIPDVATFAGTQQDTFESGNYARWTRIAGDFTVATNGATRVLRQSSLAGDAGAYLGAIDWADQSIEADLRPIEFAGNDRWFGLVTRRVDASNYYYVTLRSPSRISLRRMHNGVVTEIASGGLRGGFTPGRNYRVRLESVGDQHMVFVDGVPRARAKDSAIAHGSPGIAGYRTRFEVDNVTVSNATRLLARFDSWERTWSDGWYRNPEGVWEFVGEPNSDIDGDGEGDFYSLGQRDNSGDVRWFSVRPLGNQVVSARVRPQNYGATTGTQDPWVGIAAQVKDDRNYYYLTLRRSNQLSLRRMVNGTVQVIATVPQPVALGTWYDLRLEIVGTNIRAFVNGDVKIQATDSTISGGGRNAMLMYKTMADWMSYIAYQP